MSLPYYRDPEDPGESRSRRRRRPSWMATAVIVAALVTGAWLVHDGTRERKPSEPAAADAITVQGGSGSGPDATPAARSAPLPGSLPTRVRIPAIHVDAPVMELGLDDDQQLETPPDTDRNLAGWFADGPAPGAPGPAVLVGHVSTHSGPGVFQRLGTLHKGSTIEVTRADHRTAVFTVYGIEVYEKRHFPGDRVYGPVPDAELRLITCGGSSSPSGYRDNVVAYARLTGKK